MATKKELMSFGKGQKQQVYRRGRVERSAAGVDNSLTGFTRADQAGASQSAEVATFLGEVMKTVPGAVDAWNKQENIDNEKEVQKGVASFKNATPKQRKKFRDAIWSGEIDPDESAYFREGLQIAQADTLTNKYGPELFVAYENWEGKSSSDPQAFDNFIEEFNEGYSTDLGSLGDGVKKDHFWPKQTALISQLASQHQQRSAENYRNQSKGLKSQHIREGFNQGDIVETGNASNPASLATMLDGEYADGILHNAVGVHYESKASGKKGEEILVPSKEKKMELKNHYPNLAEDAIRVGSGGGRGLTADFKDPTFIDDSTAGLQEGDSLFEDILSGETLPPPYSNGEHTMAPKPLVSDNKKYRNKTKNKRKPKSHMENVVTEWVGPDETRDQHGLISYGSSEGSIKRIGDFQDELQKDLGAWGYEDKTKIYIVKDGKYKGQLRMQFGSGVNEEDQASIWTKIAEKHNIGFPKGSQKTADGKRLYERETYKGGI